MKREKTVEEIRLDLEALWEEWDELYQSGQIGDQLDAEQEMLIRLIEDCQNALADAQRRGDSV